MSPSDEFLISLYKEYKQISLEQKKITEKRKEIACKLINFNKEILNKKNEGSFTVRLPENCDGFFRIVKQVKRELKHKRIIEDFIKLPKPFRECLKPVYVLDLKLYRKALKLGLNFSRLDYVEEKQQEPKLFLVNLKESGK
jgi:hypothetical protein